MKKLIIILLLSIFFISCKKDEPPCKCAVIVDYGYNKYGMPLQKLTFCDGDTMIWWIPDSTWRLNPDDCWEKLRQLDSLKNVKLNSL